MEAAKRGAIRVEPSPDDDNQRAIETQATPSVPAPQTTWKSMTSGQKRLARHRAIEKGAPQKATVANLARHDENTCGKATETLA
jgi:hypothetical protein